MMILPKIMIFPKISPEYPSDVVRIKLLPTNRSTNSFFYIFVMVSCHIFRRILPLNKVLLTSLLCFYFGLIFPDSLFPKTFHLETRPHRHKLKYFSITMEKRDQWLILSGKTVTRKIETK